MAVNGGVQITQCRCYYDFPLFVQLDNYIYHQMLMIKGYQTNISLK